MHGILLIYVSANIGSSYSSVPGAIDANSTLGRGFRDGTALITTAEKDGSRSVRTVDSSGRLGTPLFKVRGIAKYPNASLDGKSIYFTAGNNVFGNMSVNAFSLSSKRFTRLIATNLGRVDSIAINRKTGHLAMMVGEKKEQTMAGSRWASFNLHIYNADSKQTKRVTVNGFRTASSVKWSWDGASITFIGRTYPANSLVRVMLPGFKTYVKEVSDRFYASVFSNDEVLLLGHDSSYPYVYGLYKMGSNAALMTPSDGSSVTDVLEVSSGRLLVICESANGKFSVQNLRSDHVHF